MYMVLSSGVTVFSLKRLETWLVTVDKTDLPNDLTKILHSLKRIVFVKG